MIFVFFETTQFSFEFQKMRVVSIAPYDLFGHMAARDRNPQFVDKK